MSQSDFSQSSAGEAGLGALPSLQLADHFLIAMPSMLDPVFGGTVVYVCEHSEKGALGLIVNRATDMSVQSLLERLELSVMPEVAVSEAASAPVLFGGPVQADRGFVLHLPRGSFSSSVAVTSRTMLTTSRDVLETVAAGNGPEKLLVTLGCAGWSAGQLEEEIGRNGWLTVQADPEVLFDLPLAIRFSAALALLGIDVSMLSGEAGHA